MDLQLTGVYPSSDLLETKSLEDVARYAAAYWALEELREECVESSRPTVAVFPEGVPW